MKRVLLVVSILLVLLAAALVYLLRGKPAPKAATLLPESTLLFLDAPDFSRARAEFQHTDLCALWQEPEVQTFLEEPRRALGAWIGSAELTAEESKTRQLILDAVEGEVFAAVTHVSVIPSLRAGLVVGVDTKGKHLDAKAALAYYERDLRKRKPNARFDAKKYLGVSYAVWKLERDQIICHAFLNSMLVFTLGEDEMRDVIARFTGQAPRDAPSLARSGKYRNVLDHLPRAHEFVAYLNVERVMNLVGPFLAFVPQAANAFQKLSRIQATASSVRFVNKQIQDVGLTAYNADSKLPPVTERKTLALTSPQTSVYAVGSFDLGTTYQEIMDSIAQSGNASLIARAAQFDRQLRSNGMRVREDLLASAGPETALIVTWREGAPFPDAAIATEIRNAGQTRSRIDLVMKALKEACLGSNEQFPLEKAQYLGETIHAVRIGGSQIAPAYVTTESFFILALAPDYVHELLGQLKQSKPTLAANTTYQQAMKQLPANARSYTYCDLSAVFRPLYGRLRTTLPGSNTTAFVALDKLPQTETIARHLSPMVSATVTEPKRETTTCYSPFGKPLTFVLAAAGGLAMAEPYWSQFAPMISPAAPTAPSNTDARPRRRGNRKAESQTPQTQ